MLLGELQRRLRRAHDPPAPRRRPPAARATSTRHGSSSADAALSRPHGGEQESITYALQARIAVLSGDLGLARELTPIALATLAGLTLDDERRGHGDAMVYAAASAGSTPGDATAARPSIWSPRYAAAGAQQGHADPRRGRRRCRRRVRRGRRARRGRRDARRARLACAAPRTPLRSTSHGSRRRCGPRSATTPSPRPTSAAGSSTAKGRSTAWTRASYARRP